MLHNHNHQHHDHQHDHHHSHAQKKADFWTRMNTVGEGFASFISGTAVYGGLYDSISGINARYGLSWQGLLLGGVLACGTTIGSTWAHRRLNILHQDLKAQLACKHTHPQPHEHPHEHEHTYLPEQNHEHLPPDAEITCESSINLEEEILLRIPEEKFEDTAFKFQMIWNAIVEMVAEFSNLSIAQKLALLADLIVHALEIAGPPTLALSLALVPIAEQIPNAAKIAARIGLFGWGVVCAVATTRTCSSAMQIDNEEEKEQQRTTPSYGSVSAT